MLPAPQSRTNEDEFKVLDGWKGVTFGELLLLTTASVVLSKAVVIPSVVLHPVLLFGPAISFIGDPMSA
jgi:hypothetical protein